MPGLKPLGRVLHQARNGYVVARLEESGSVPPLNVPVYDEQRRRIGVLLDVIGPVTSPYAVVKPASGAAPKPGDMLYYQPPAPRRRPRRRPERRARTQRPSPRRERRPGPRGGARRGGGPRGGGGRRRGPRRGGKGARR